MEFRTKKLITLASVLFLLIVASPAWSADLGDISELEAFLDGMFAMQMQEYQVPGIAVAVIQGDQVLLSKGYGFANLEQSHPMDPETTLHRTGSNSKILVWTAVLQLVEQGKLDLYTDITEYLDFPIPTKTADGKEVLPITLHHLMTHTAGLEEVVTQLLVTKPEAMQPLGQYLLENLPSRVFPPGSVLSYSNYGTALAAYIVECVSGRSFADYVKEHILDPLEMNRSTFTQPVPPELASFMSKGYYYKGGRYIPAEFEYIQAYPAGALTSTVGDMTNLIRALLHLGVFGEQRILSEATARLMQEQQFTSHPELPGVTYGLLEANYNGHRVLSHGGDTFFFHTGLYFLPEKQVGLYVVYNSADSVLARWSFFQSFMDRYFPAQDGGVKPSPIASGNENSYLGVFHHARSNFTKPEAWIRFLQGITLSVDEEGYLILTVQGKQTRYGEISPGLFQEVGGKDRMALSFKDGQVSQIHFPGPDTFLRTPWYHTTAFVGGLLGVSVLFMLLTVIGWIKQLFRPKSKPRSFVLPKILGLVVILVCVTTLIIFVDAVLNFHPDVNIPLMLFESPLTLKAVLLLAKVLVGLGVVQILTALYLWVTGKGSLWQRVYYTLLTLSVGGVIWVLWQVNFL